MKARGQVQQKKWRETQKIIDSDPFFKKCAFFDCECTEIEIDHVWTGIGQKQKQDWWAVIPYCYPHHRGKLRTKEVQEYGQWLSLMRGLKLAEQEYPKEVPAWHITKARLDAKFVGKEPENMTIIL